MALTKISGSILKDPLNLGEVSIGGTLTYQDVTNVDSVGVITARSGINVSGGQLDVGSNIKLGNAGVITATTFSGDPSGTGNINAGILDLKTGGNLRLRFSSGGTAQFRGDVDPIASFDRGSANSTNVKWGYLGADRGIISSISNEFRIAASGTIPMTFHSNGSERLRITSTGYIGINTSSPQYPLHVAGHTTDSSPDGIGVLMGLQHNHALIHLNAESDMGCIIDFSTPNNDRKGGILYYHSNNSVVANRDAMQFHTAGAERLRITSGGHTLFSGLTDHNDSTRNVKGITIKSTGGVSFQNFGSNGSRNWRIRPDDMSRWGDLDFSVSPTANSATDWPDAATDKVLTLGYDGTVLKPRNPAFIAGRTGGNQTFTVGTFPLNVARLNVGNHYNTSTYKFVAPVAGVYYFYAQVYYNNGAGQYRMGFRKTPSGGSAFMLNTSSHKPGSNDTADHMSIIESLAVNDTVELYSDSNYSIQCYYNINDATYGAHTYLMGYLIG